MERLQAEAKKNSPEFQRQMDSMFGEDALKVQRDLIDGNQTEDVKYLLFSELSDFQPISMAEMPVYYLNSGNGRVFYMLKTYTIKLIDIHRREIFANLASGDSKKVAKGMKNLVSLSFALMLMGMASDELKDLVLGRKVEPSDLVITNLIKLSGATKYQIYKAKDDGIGEAVLMTLFVPPNLAPLNDISKDINKIGFGEKPLKDSETIGKTPIVGKLYYWWYGGGKAKDDKKKGKTKELK
jgi:hypothetical protein